VNAISTSFHVSRVRVCRRFSALAARENGAVRLVADQSRTRTSNSRQDGNGVTGSPARRLQRRLRDRLDEERAVRAAANAVHAPCTVFYFVSRRVLLHTSRLRTWRMRSRHSPDAPGLRCYASREVGRASAAPCTPSGKPSRPCRRTALTGATLEPAS